MVHPRELPWYSRTVYASNPIQGPIPTPGTDAAAFIEALPLASCVHYAGKSRALLYTWKPMEKLEVVLSSANAAYNVAVFRGQDGL